jgi:hypothetical protein
MLGNCEALEEGNDNDDIDWFWNEGRREGGELVVVVLVALDNVVFATAEEADDVLVAIPDIGIIEDNITIRINKDNNSNNDEVVSSCSTSNILITTIYYSSSSGLISFIIVAAVAIIIMYSLLMT